MIATKPSWEDALAELAPTFSERATRYDATDAFVEENYADLRDAGLFAALVPEQLGGEGVPYGEVCELVRRLGRVCGSTALTFSMHQHLVAAALWNHARGKPGEKLLRAVGEGGKILASTGAADWLGSNGELTPADGGYLFRAKKVFASGCLAADLLVTSGRLEAPGAEAEVLHFPVPMRSDGVRIDRVWKTLGMRGTGSHTVVLNDVFIPEETVALRRPADAYHPAWSVILTVALPLVCAAYVGVSEAAAEKARSSARRKVEAKGDDGATPLLIGEMENELAAAQLAFESLVAEADDLRVEADVATANRALIRKTLLADAGKRVADKALEATGGGGYFRASGLERMLRDLEAAQFHPLPAKKQHRFTGRLAMGLDPVDV